MNVCSNYKAVVLLFTFKSLLQKLVMAHDPIRQRRYDANWKRFEQRFSHFKEKLYLKINTTKNYSKQNYKRLEINKLFLF